MSADHRAWGFRPLDPLAWTIPVGLVGTATALLCLLTVAVYGRIGRAIPCDIEGRLAASLALATAVGCACLPVTIVERPVARAALAVLCGVAGAVFAWWLVGAAFLPRC